MGGKTVPNLPTEQCFIRPQIRIGSWSPSPPPAVQLPGTLLLPEVDETVGGLRDGCEGPDGGVADSDCSFVSLLRHIIIVVIIQQVDDIPDSSTNGDVLLPVIFMFGLIRLEYFICVSMFKSQGLLWLLTQAGVWIHLVSPLWTHNNIFRKTRLNSNIYPATWLTWVSTLCFVQSWQQIFRLEGQKNSYFVDTKESIFSPGILKHLWLLDAEFCVSAIVSQGDHSLADVTFLSVAGEMSRTINRPISGCEGWWGSSWGCGAVYLTVLHDSASSSSSFRALFLRGFNDACKETQVSKISR